MKNNLEIRAANEKSWREHLQRIQEHQGTLTSYCQNHGLSLASLIYWRKKLGREASSFESRTKNKEKLSPFIPVQVLPPESRVSEWKLPAPKWLAELIVHLSNSKNSV